MAEVRLQHLSKSFGRQEVLHDVSLTIGDGEFCVFLGPSGCGKSTLLRLIAGLESPSSGAIHIGHRDVTALPPKKRDLAMVFQSYALYPHMTAFENMAFGLRLAGGRQSETAQRVRAAARTLDIEHLLDRRPAELSGGQRQRVAIGRAIVRQPRVFLFDEPLSNLDADLRVRMRLEFSRLHQRLQATMVYVTHDQVEAMTLADRLVVMENGRVAQVGAPLELYHQPRNLFVAGFIGSPRMNMLAGRLERISKGTAVVLLSGGARVQVAVDATRAAPGESVTLGVRPEHLMIGSDDANSIHGRRASVEHLGDYALIYVDWCPEADPIVIRVVGNAQLEIPNHIDIGITPHACHLFDLDGQAFPRSGNPHR